MKNFTKYFLILAIRSKFFQTSSVIFGLILFGSLFFGSLFASEQNETSFAYFLGTLKIYLIYSSIIFSSTFVSNIFESKEINILVSTPHPRYFIILSLFASLSVIILASCIMGFAISCIFIKKGFFLLQIFYWFYQLFLELLIIISFSIFASIGLSRLMFCIFATVCFYLLSSTVGYILPILQEDGYAIKVYAKIGIIIMKTISAVLPRLDLFAESFDALYSKYTISEVARVTVQSIIYIPLLLTASIIDFKKKDL